MVIFLVIAMHSAVTYSGIGDWYYKKKYLNIRTKFTGLVSENAFGIYVFHAPLIIIISLLLKHWVTFPLLKFVTVTIITFFVCLAFSFLVRKIKPIGFIFK
jgi:surface polysaccharide O-acyltransferase-like enzyme